MPLEQDTMERITESRNVLYNPERTSEDYVNTYEKMWADAYTKDGHELGFKSWEYALDRIPKLMPNKESLILDYCGGTGEVGKRLHAAGYKHLHIVDGSMKMLKQALELHVYERHHNEVVGRQGRSEFLETSGFKYDVVLSSMSLAEFKPLVQQVVNEALAPGGIFLCFESEPHIEKAHLDGIPWIIEEAQKPDSNFELLENSTELPHDTFTDHKMKILIVKKKK